LYMLLLFQIVRWWPDIFMILPGKPRYGLLMHRLILFILTANDFLAHIN